MLSNCAAFQTLVGAADATAALDSIYRGGSPDPEEDRRSESEIETLYPAAYIWTPDEGWSCEHASTGVGNRFLTRGTLMLCIAHFSDLSLTTNANYAADMTTYSDIIEDFLKQTGPGGLYVRKVSLLDRSVSSYSETPGRSDFDPDRHRVRDLVEVTFSIEWGSGENS